MGPSYSKHLLSEISLLLNDRVPLGMEVNTVWIPNEFVMTITITLKANSVHSGWAVKRDLTVIPENDAFVYMHVVYC